MVPLLYAHRGSHRHAPENTLAAFRAAIEEGADGIELDVRTCASGEVVVSHDPHLGRVAGRAAQIAMLPWERVRAVRIGGGERVPLLDEVLDLAGEARVNVEVKSDVPDRCAVARAVASVLARRSASDRGRVVLSTFDAVVFGALRRRVSDVPLAFLFDRDHTGAVRGPIARRLLRPDGLHPHEALCTPDRVRRWRARGLFVAPWTVNDPQRARWLAGLGVDAIITDDIPALRDALRR